MKEVDNTKVTEQLRDDLRGHLDQCKTCQEALRKIVSKQDEEFGGKAGPEHDQSRSDASTLMDSNAKLESVDDGTVVESPTAFADFKQEAVAHDFPDPPANSQFIASVGRYQIRRLVAHGGMSTLYSAYDTVNECSVVLKVMSSWLDAEEGARERIAREAMSAKRVQHPHVIEVFDLLLRNDLPPTVVMEELSGTTLRHLLSDRELLDSRESATLLAGAARGLACCHEAGVIHRDVKPSNLLVEVVDGQQRLVVSDFGIARDDTHDQTLTKAGGLLGTPAYMSPEQIRDPASVDARSDVYSLGCVLYEMLTGRPPFLGSVRMLLWQATHETPKSPRSLNERVDRPLETICLKAITSSPAHRYATAAEFADDLQRYLDGKPIEARPPGLIRRFSKMCQRYPIRLTVAASTFLLLTGVSTVSFIAANRMADARSKEHDALEKASANALIAEEQSELHQKAAATAEQQSRLAFETMTQVITNVEQGLSSLPKGSPIRKNLLQTSLQSLDQAAEEFVGRSVISLHSARTMFQLAVLYDRFQKPGDGNETAGEGYAESANQTADRLFTQAYEVAWRCYEEQGGSLEALRLAQEIKTQHGQHMMYREDGEASAVQAFERSMELALMLVGSSENKFKAHMAVVFQLEMLSELARRRGEMEKASDYLEQSLKLSNEHFPSDLGSGASSALAAYEHRLIQYAMLAEFKSNAGDEDEAREARRRGFETNLAIITALEAQGNRELEIAGQRVAGMFFMVQLGDLEGAVAEGTEVAQYLEGVYEEDHSDSRIRKWLTAAYSQLQVAYEKLGKPEDSAVWQKKLLEVLSPAGASKVAGEADKSTTEKIDKSN